MLNSCLETCKYAFVENISPSKALLKSQALCRITELKCTKCTLFKCVMLEQYMANKYVRVLVVFCQFFFTELLCQYIVIKIYKVPKNRSDSSEAKSSHFFQVKNHAVQLTYRRRNLTHSSISARDAHGPGKCGLGLSAGFEMRARAGPRAKTGPNFHIFPSHFYKIGWFFLFLKFLTIFLFTAG